MFYRNSFRTEAKSSAFIETIPRSMYDIRFNLKICLYIDTNTQFVVHVLNCLSFMIKDDKSPASLAHFRRIASIKCKSEGSIHKTRNIVWYTIASGSQTTHPGEIHQEIERSANTSPWNVEQKTSLSVNDVYLFHKIHSCKANTFTAGI